MFLKLRLVLILRWNNVYSNWLKFQDRIVKRHLVGIDMDEPVSKTISQKYKNAASWHTPMDIDSVYDHKWHVVTKHVVQPSFADMEENPRCRSAKLRCAIKNDV